MESLEGTMLIACKHCRRQFAVDQGTIGSTVRCFCGVRIKVDAPWPREIRMQHCASCGAGLEAGAKACSFCKSAVSLAERGLGDVCPSCMCRLVRDAKFCSSCGIAIQPARLLKEVSEQSCPRCKVTMTACSVTNVSFAECEQCGGLWLDETTVRQMVTDRERSAAPAILGAVQTHAPDQDVDATRNKVSYVPCPVCRDLMNRQNFGGISGVIVDWCRGHGFWFDAHELEAVFAFVNGGGIERARARQIEELEQKKREVRHSANLRMDPLATRALFEAPTSHGLFGMLARWLADRL